MNELSVILSASSILLGIMTALYGFFYPSINKILEIDIKMHSLDNIKNFQKAKTIEKSRMIPLVLINVIITLIFLPEMYIRLKNGLDYIKIYGCSYDVITVSFVAICIFMIVLTINSIITEFKLLKKIRKLNPKRDQNNKDK